MVAGAALNFAVNERGRSTARYLPTMSGLSLLTLKPPVLMPGETTTTAPALQPLPSTVGVEVSTAAGRPASEIQPGSKRSTRATARASLQSQRHVAGGVGIGGSASKRRRLHAVSVSETSLEAEVVVAPASKRRRPAAPIGSVSLDAGAATSAAVGESIRGGDDTFVGDEEPDADGDGGVGGGWAPGASSSAGAAAAQPGRPGSHVSAGDDANEGDDGEGIPLVDMMAMALDGVLPASSSSSSGRGLHGAGPDGASAGAAGRRGAAAAGSRLSHTGGHDDTAGRGSLMVSHGRSLRRSLGTGSGSGYSQHVSAQAKQQQRRRRSARVQGRTEQQAAAAATSATAAQPKPDRGRKRKPRTVVDDDDDEAGGSRVRSDENDGNEGWGEMSAARSSSDSDDSSVEILEAGRGSGGGVDAGTTGRRRSDTAGALAGPNRRHGDGSVTNSSSRGQQDAAAADGQLLRLDNGLVYRHTQRTGTVLHFPCPHRTAATTGSTRGIDGSASSAGGGSLLNLRASGAVPSRSSSATGARPPADLPYQAGVADLFKHPSAGAAGTVDAGVDSVGSAIAGSASGRHTAPEPSHHAPVPAGSPSPHSNVPLSARLATGGSGSGSIKSPTVSLASAAAAPAAATGPEAALPLVTSPTLAAPAGSLIHSAPPKGTAQRKQLQHVPATAHRTPQPPADAHSIDCVICQEAVAPADRGFLPCCFHAFHWACILQWAGITNTCAVCKRAFSTVARLRRLDSDLVADSTGAAGSQLLPSTSSSDGGVAAESGVNALSMLPPGDGRRGFCAAESGALQRLSPPPQALATPALVDAAPSSDAPAAGPAGVSRGVGASGAAAVVRRRSLISALPACPAMSPPEGAGIRAGTSPQGLGTLGSLAGSANSRQQHTSPPPAAGAASAQRSPVPLLGAGSVRSADSSADRSAGGRIAACSGGAGVVSATPLGSSLATLCAPAEATPMPVVPDVAVATSSAQLPPAAGTSEGARPSAGAGGNSSLCSVWGCPGEWCVRIEEEVAVPERTQTYQPSVEDLAALGYTADELDAPCYLCDSGDHEDTLLLCDGHCGRAAHTACLHLSAVPEGDWFCEYCRDAGRAPASYVSPRRRAAAAAASARHSRRRRRFARGSAESDSGASGSSDDDEDEGEVAWTDDEDEGDGVPLHQLLQRRGRADQQAGGRRTRARAPGAAFAGAAAVAPLSRRRGARDSSAAGGDAPRYPTRGSGAAVAVSRREAARESVVAELVAATMGAMSGRSGGSGGGRLRSSISSGAAGSRAAGAGPRGNVYGLSSVPSGPIPRKRSGGGRRSGAVLPASASSLAAASPAAAAYAPHTFGPFGAAAAASAVSSAGAGARQHARTVAGGRVASAALAGQHWLSPAGPQASSGYGSLGGIGLHRGVYGRALDEEGEEGGGEGHAVDVQRYHSEDEDSLSGAVAGRRVWGGPAAGARGLAPPPTLRQRDRQLLEAQAAAGVPASSMARGLAQQRAAAADVAGLHLQQRRAAAAAAAAAASAVAAAGAGAKAATAAAPSAFGGGSGTVGAIEGERFRPRGRAATQAEAAAAAAGSGGQRGGAERAGKAGRRGGGRRVVVVVGAGSDEGEEEEEDTPVTAPPVKRGRSNESGGDHGAGRGGNEGGAGARLGSRGPRREAAASPPPGAQGSGAATQPAPAPAAQLAERIRQRRAERAASAAASVAAAPAVLFGGSGRSRDGDGGSAGLLEPSREWGGDGGSRSGSVSHDASREGASRVAGEPTAAGWGGESLDGHSERNGDYPGPPTAATAPASIAGASSAGSHAAAAAPTQPAGRRSTLLALQRGAAAPGVSSPALSSPTLSSLAALSAVPPRRPSDTGSGIGASSSSRPSGSEAAPAAALGSPGMAQQQQQPAVLSGCAPAPPGSLAAMMRAVEHQATARERDATAWKRTLQPQAPAVGAASATGGLHSRSGAGSDASGEGGSTGAAAPGVRPPHAPTAVSAATASPTLTFPAPQPAGAAGFFSALARPPAASGSAGVGAMPPLAAAASIAQLPGLPAPFTPLSALPSVLPSLTALSAAGGSGAGGVGAGAASQAAASERSGHSKHSRHQHHSAHKHKSGRHHRHSGRTDREAADR